MLDIRYIKENLELCKEAAKNKLGGVVHIGSLHKTAQH